MKLHYVGGVVLFQLAQSAVHRSFRPIGDEVNCSDKENEAETYIPRHTHPPKRMQNVINRRTGGKKNILFLSSDKG